MFNLTVHVKSIQALNLTIDGIKKAADAYAAGQYPVIKFSASVGSSLCYRGGKGLPIVVRIAFKTARHSSYVREDGSTSGRFAGRIGNTPTMLEYEYTMCGGAPTVNILDYTDDPLSALM